MSYNGSGTFNINTAGQPVVTGTVISSTAFNALTADLGTGLSTAITKNGQTTVTANIPFNGYKLTGIAVATASGDALSYGQAATVSALTDSALTSGRVPYASTAGLFVDSANLTFNGTTLTAAGFSGPISGVVTSTSITDSGLTSGRVTYAGTGGLLQDSANLTFNGTTLTANTLNLTNALGTAYGGTGLTSFTANGVVYASSTSALATGSALTFDGTSLVVGGTSSPNYKLACYVASGNNGITIGNGSNTGADYAGLDFYMASAQKAVIYTNSNNLTINASAGAAIFQTGSSEQMRLTSTGLGIGTTSPSQKLEVAGNAKLTGTNLSIVPSTATSAAYTLNTNTGGNFFLGIDSSTGASFTGTAYGRFLYSGGAYPMIFLTNDTERMRLDSGGKLLLGVTNGTGLSNSDFAMVNGGSIRFRNAANSAYISTFYFNTSNGLDIGVGGSLSTITFGISGIGEVSRFDTSGNLLVGQTTVGVQNSNSFSFNISNGSQATNHITGSASGNYYGVFTYAGTIIGSVTQSGTTAVLYNTTSDQRLKENIQDADSASSLIDSLQVRQFDWKSDNSHQRYGFIAQELVTVAPEAVHQPIDSEEMMAVDYSKLVPMLVKEIQSLRARVAQLETKGV